MSIFFFDYFIELSIKNGIDIIRVFDALNDVRNIEVSIKSIKKYNGHCQCAISYTTSPIHTTEYYLKLVKTMEKMGADSICIKDMAGVLTPYNAYDLVKRMKDVTKLPIELHTHCTSGIADMIYMKAVEAGVDIIDTAISPFSGGTSQPPTESLAVTFSEDSQTGGLLYYLYQGVKLGIFPPLIFLCIGASTDFGPMIANPKTMLLGAAYALR